MAIPTLFMSKNECCGCEACANICSQNAIRMITDTFGNTFPVIDPERCVGCNACLSVCNYVKKNDCNDVKQAYAAKSKENELMKQSSSGGVFSSIASVVLSNGGIVYGAAYDSNDELSVRHIRVEDTVKLKLLQGTKYVQSCIGKNYKLVKDDLEKGRTVLFSGTPCQVDGLYGFLKNRRYENLYTIDILCHGTPGSGFYQSYIAYLKKKISNGSLVDISFRDKIFGWGAKGSYSINKNRKIYKKMLTPHNSVYYRLFLDSASYRENCYSCKYASQNRVGDISIGDYWGIGESHPELLKEWKKSEGISCILVNTEQGANLIRTYGQLLDLKESSVEKIARKNKILERPCKDNSERNTVRKLYEESGFKAIEKWYWKKQGIKRYFFLVADVLRNIRNV